MKQFTNYMFLSIYIYEGMNVERHGHIFIKINPALFCILTVSFLNIYFFINIS